MPPSALSRRHQSARRVAVVSGQARGSGQCASRLNLTRLDSTGCRVLGQACRRGAALTWSAGNLAGATRSSGCKSCPRPGQRQMTVVSCCGSLATPAPWPVLASSNARALACAGTSSSSRCLPPLRGGLSHEVAFHRCHVGAQPRRHSLDCAALPAGAIRHIPQLVLEESPVPGDESIALAHTPPAVASACLHIRAAASRDGQRAAGASKPAARGSATTGAVQQQRGARSGSLTRSWRTGHCCALPARAAAQPQPCPHTRGSRHHQIMSAVPVRRRRRVRTRGRERVHERACGRRGDGLGALAPERIGARVAAVDRGGGRRRAALAIRRHELGRGAHVGHRATFARVHGGATAAGSATGRRKGLKLAAVRGG